MVQHVVERVGHEAASAVLIGYTTLDDPASHSEYDIWRRGERCWADGTGHFDRDDTTICYAIFCEDSLSWLFERVGKDKLWVLIMGKLFRSPGRLTLNVNGA